MSEAKESVKDVLARIDRDLISLGPMIETLHRGAVVKEWWHMYGQFNVLALLVERLDAERTMPRYAKYSETPRKEDV
jgi:hypothetical protein